MSSFERSLLRKSRNVSSKRAGTLPSNFLRSVQTGPDSCGNSRAPSTAASQRDSCLAISDPILALQGTDAVAVSRSWPRPSRVCVLVLSKSMNQATARFGFGSAERYEMPARLVDVAGTSSVNLHAVSMKKSSIEKAGMGLFTNGDAEEGEFLGEYGGELISDKQAKLRRAKVKSLRTHINPILKFRKCRGSINTLFR